MQETQVIDQAWGEYGVESVPSNGNQPAPAGPSEADAIHQAIIAKSQAEAMIRELISELAHHASPATLGHLVNAVYALEEEIGKMLSATGK